MGAELNPARQLPALGQSLWLDRTGSAGNTERTKRYFREAPGRRRTHIHARRRELSEQVPVLLRDYLRHHDRAAAGFATVKRRLAEQGWGPGPGDA